MIVGLKMRISSPSSNQRSVSGIWCVHEIESQQRSARRVAVVIFLLWWRRFRVAVLMVNPRSTGWDLALLLDLWLTALIIYHFSNSPLLNYPLDFSCSKHLWGVFWPKMLQQFLNYWKWERKVLSHNYSGCCLKQTNIFMYTPDRVLVFLSVAKTQSFFWVDGR